MPRIAAIRFGGHAAPHLDLDLDAQSVNAYDDAMARAEPGGRTVPQGHAVALEDYVTSGPPELTVTAAR